MFTVIHNTQKTKPAMGVLFTSLFSVTSTMAITNNKLDAIQVVPIPQTQAIVAQTPQTSSEDDARLQEMTERLRNMTNTLQEQSAKKQLANSQSLTVQQKSAFSALQQRVGDSLQIRLRDNGTLMQIQGHQLEPAVTWSANSASKRERAQVTTRRFLRFNRALLRLEQPDSELTLIRQNSDELQRSHLRFQQMYKGLPVWPAELTVHLDPQGNVDLMNGAYVPTPNKPISIKPIVAADKAIDIVLTELPSADEVGFSDPELIIYAPEMQSPRLAWKMHIDISASEKWLVIVDALTGAVLTKYNKIHSSGRRGSGQDLLGETRSLELWEDNGTFLMINTSKPMFNPNQAPNDDRGSIFVFDLDYQSPPPDGKPILSGSNRSNSGFIPEAVSLAFNLSEAYDYYLNKHARDSLDGRGQSILGIVRMGGELGELNAFWNGAGLFFGHRAPFAGSLDVVAHEFQHGVTQYTANLIYQNQPGTLNESFSDIFGEMVEARTFGRTDWIMGSSMPSSLYRNLRDPNASGDPKNMSQFRHTNEDNGGVHINMTIVAHAYYLLAEGLDGGIGIHDAEKIFYRALTTHLVRNSQFIDARLATIRAADELFGQNSTQSQKVAQAFDAVEIFGNQPSTPSPPSFPTVNGIDATLSICIDRSGKRLLCRHDEGLGDGKLGAYISQADLTPSRLSVTGDGQLAAFVNASHDMCFIEVGSKQPGQEECLNMPGEVHSVAMAPDGQHYGFVMQDKNSGEIENTIMFIDLTDESRNRVFNLMAPTIDGADTNTILFADAMDLTRNGRLLIYDALNVIHFADGSQASNWSIYAIELNTGQTLTVIPPQAGLNIGNPSLSQTTDNFMAFFASAPQESKSAIFATNLNTGEIKQVGSTPGQYSVAGYTGDDSAIVYDSQDSSTLSGSSLVYQAVGEDRISPVGDLKVWLKDASYGTIYRRGEFINTPEREGGFFLTPDVWIKAQIHTEEKGIIDAVWRPGGDDKTSRGDRVIWGHFYASPSDVTWGNENNPDLFVKAWFDVSGRIDVNYFHVSVPDIYVYSAKKAGDILSGTTTMTTRYVRQVFNPDGTQDVFTENTSGGEILYIKHDPLSANVSTNAILMAEIHTVEKGGIRGVFYQGGLGQSQRGDKVGWGYYSASPNDVSWGNPNNPEVFFKLWWDVSGRTDVNFFHVSVPDITVSSQLSELESKRILTDNQTSRVTLQNRYTRHEYSPR